MLIVGNLMLIVFQILLMLVMSITTLFMLAGPETKTGLFTPTRSERHIYALIVIVCVMALLISFAVI